MASSLVSQPASDIPSQLTSSKGTKRTRTGGDSQSPDDTSKSARTAISHFARPFAIGTVFNHALADSVVDVLRRESLDEIAKQRDLSGFQQVNVSDMKACEGMTRTDPLIMVAVQFILNSLLGGDILFGWNADESDGTDSSAKANKARWMSTTWSEFAVKVNQQQWEYGFAAVYWLPHPLYGAKPVVLDLTQMNVYVKTTRFSERAWVYRSKSASSNLNGGVDPVTSQIRNEVSQSPATGTSGPTSGIFPDIMTLVLSPPDENGRVRSIVQTTLAEAKYVRDRRDLQLKAETDRARPPWFSEEVKAKAHDPDELTDPSGGDAPSGGGGGDGRPVPPRRSAERRERDEKEGAMLGIARSYGIDKLQNLIRRAQQSDEDRATGSGVGDRVDVPVGRTVRPATMPEVPADIIKMRLMQFTSVLMEFGIPAGLIQTENANGRSAVNESAKEAWGVALRVVKQRNLAWMYDVGHAMYDSHVYMKKFLETGSVTISDADFTIMLPGIPSDAKLAIYYDKGLLKLEAYKKYICAMDSIDIDDLEDEVDPPQTVYEAPPDPVIGGGGAKKPAAKKKKKKGASKKAKNKRRAVHKDKKKG